MRPLFEFARNACYRRGRLRKVALTLAPVTFVKFVDGGEHSATGGVGCLFMLGGAAAVAALVAQPTLWPLLLPVAAFLYFFFKGISLADENESLERRRGKIADFGKRVAPIPSCHDTENSAVLVCTNDQCGGLIRVPLGLSETVQCPHCRSDTRAMSRRLRTGTGARGAGRRRLVREHTSFDASVIYRIVRGSDGVLGRIASRADIGFRDEISHEVALNCRRFFLLYDTRLRHVRRTIRVRPDPIRSSFEPAHT